MYERHSIEEYMGILDDTGVMAIPAKYIDKVVLYYGDNGTKEISGEAFTKPIPLEGSSRWEELKKKFTDVTDVKMHLNLIEIECDMEFALDDLYESLITDIRK
jgi:hypothetical protein